MKTYRLDRRFALPAVGISLIIAGLAAALAFVLSSVAALAWIFGVGAVLALLNGLRTIAFPPTVVRLDPASLRVGGQLTVRPVDIPWLDIEDVTVEGTRLLIDRGDGQVLVFPLAYVGARSGELLREIYDGLNSANGYRRFDPS
ncbi:hypothetical protein C6I20_15060 [Aeromicrobium sp. A1-2]|uniref:hypothetical protein n=1 Tax=Aeromicrobium sp. A1-2 TaxID=2107713 RepID=UPI000E484B2F|nr:hypothetical protein [Aeromicrobium sp. A1-2]AXT86364.1 hypothetical protein C6I20_15060 [Aeromicrobium sp. A1-2]